MAVDPGGYDVPRFEERRADEIVPEWQLRFGAGSNTASSTDDGLIIDTLTAFAQACDEKGSLAYNSGFFNTATGLNLDALIGGLFGTQRAPDRGSTGQVVVYGDEGTIVSPAADPSQVSTPRGDVYGLTGPVTLEFGNIAVFVFGPTSGTGTSTTMTIGVDTYGPTLALQGTGFQVAQNMHALLPGSDVNIADKNEPYEDASGNGVLVIDLTGLQNSTVSATASEAEQFRGVAQTLATSVEPGDIPGQEGQINTIATPLDGWQGVMNTETVTPGATEDTDAEYRQRHLDTLGKGGTSSLIALISILRDITRNPGVEFVQIYNNPEGLTDSSGRPGHSFEVVIKGGEDLTIVTLIWENHPLGIQTFGAEEFLIEDERTAGTHIIRFTRPTEKPVYAKVTITAGEGFPAEDVSDIQNDVANTFVTFGDSLGIGRNVYIDELKQQLDISGTQSIEIELGFSPPPATAPANLTVGENELTTWDVSQIVTVVNQ